MRLVLTIATLAALTACSGKSADRGPERKSAAGEVLGGEVSDDMLPLDTVRSTSPPGRSAPAGDATAQPAGAGTRSPSPPRPGPSASPDPAVEPAPAPQPSDTPPPQ